MRMCLMLIASAALLWGCAADPYKPRSSSGPSTAETPVTIKMGGMLQAGVGVQHP